jgi:hypothetical protein
MHVLVPLQVESSHFEQLLEEAHEHMANSKGHPLCGKAMGSDGNAKTIRNRCSCLNPTAHAIEVGAIGSQAVKPLAQAQLDVISHFLLQAECTDGAQIFVSKYCTNSPSPSDKERRCKSCAGQAGQHDSCSCNCPAVRQQSIPLHMCVATMAFAACEQPQCQHGTCVGAP